MPNYDDLFSFLQANYRRSRFDQHSDKGKAERICKMYMEDLELYGVAHVSRHEDPVGQGFKFDASLTIYRGKNIEYRNNAGHLTHLF